LNIEPAQALNEAAERLERIGRASVKGCIPCDPAAYGTCRTEEEKNWLPRRTKSRYLWPTVAGALWTFL